MLRKDYIDWAYRETKRDLPYERLLNDWFVNWEKTLSSIRKVHGIFEVVAIVFSKCEVLGLLYRGNIDKSNWEDYKVFTDKFFKPEYKKLHKISRNRNLNSESYTLFRNKILHSGQPVGIDDKENVIGWRMGYGPNLRSHHLKIDYEDNLNIHCGVLIDDFLEAMGKYVQYLKRDKHLIGNIKPSIRFYEAFWATFCPLYSDKKVWMKEWYELERKK